MRARRSKALLQLLTFVLLVALQSGAVLAAQASVAVPVLDAEPAMNGAIDDSWAKAAVLTLNVDFTNRRKAEEPTKVYIAQDDSYLDVAFAVTQRESPVASQETNSASVLGDDYIGMYLYPQGVQGIAYSFVANPRGARYQTSSENTAYTPQWVAVGRSTPYGYSVTLRVPLAIIRSGGSATWRAQFVRATVATNSLDVWSYNSRAANAGDPAFSGTLTGIGAGERSKAASRPQARLQPYALSESTSKENGGSTSRIGADFSLPVAPTISFLGTLHPDYSNVEIDQQTIAPTPYARQYQEIRPFFTQTANYFNQHQACLNCPMTLYTPSIPIFGQGYAIEGTEGYASFAAYDAIGEERNDAAQALNYTYENPDLSYSANLQHVASTQPDLSDATTTLNLGYTDNRSHLFVYANSGQDRGTNVTDATLGNYFETGVGYSDALGVAGVSIQSIGAQFNPVDGYVAQTDIHGYESFFQRTFNFAPQFALHDISATVFYSRYNDRFDLLAQTNADTQVNFDFRNLLTVHVYQNAIGVRTFDGEFLPFDGNGATLGYRMNTSTPSYVDYSAGEYYHGALDAWTYVTTLQLLRGVHLSLETDESRYETSWPGEQSTNQWLERAAIDWQFSRDASFDIGVRRIIGANLPNSFEPISYGNTSICFYNPYNPGCFVNAGNVTAAFHFLAARNEFYIVYGNANNLSTEPALFLKWIRYIGAEKGT
jgi:Domain of unknown function (DUF5916)